MARVNVGVHPEYLTDQWLVAESVEITMITGGLRKNKYRIKGKVPDKFVLGTGHINFFKPKLKYLQMRLDVVNIEMVRRGFTPGTSLDDLTEFPAELYCSWNPTQRDSDLLRQRLIWKIQQKPELWRWNRKKLIDPEKYCKQLWNSPLYEL